MMRTDCHLGGIDMEPRKSRVKITYKDKDITESLLPYLTDMTYTDSADGESDSLAVNLSDRSRRWVGGWMPEKGDKISASILTYNWEKDGDKGRLSCGEFIVDSLSASGEPLTLSIGAISGPVSSGFRETTRSKTWKKTTIKAIAEIIAKRYKLTIVYDAPKISVKELEQSDNDSSFLASLCETYGLTLKAYKSKLVIFDRERYKKKAPVATITRLKSPIASWSYSDTLTRVYTGAQITYTDSDSGKDIKKTVGSKKVLLKLSDSADSAADAERKARAAVNKENHGKTTMSLDMMGNVNLVSGCCVDLKDFGSKISGKYFINRATHTVSSSGYRTSLELSKVGKSI